MIVTDIKSFGRQGIGPGGMAKVMDFLRREDLGGLADGKIAIDGERVFALVQRYETVITTAPKFECHRKYIDIQYIASGSEIIGWVPLERLDITEAYDADKDACFGTVMNGGWTPVHLQAGELAVFYPEDGHAPKMAVNSPSPVMKIVIKIAVELINPG
ncbi:MAG: YhcH/YjgK/YiaL family protein [Elusimicrobia bacterium]|nr:YhcH/YjgK/YiaL family protein [Elusimicrobiota bacterium]